MAEKSTKKINLAKSQAVSLLDTLQASVSDVNDVNLNLDILLENLGIGRGILGEDLTSAQMLEDIVDKGRILKKAISAIKQIKKSKKDLEALTRPEVGPSDYLRDIRQRGADYVAGQKREFEKYKSRRGLAPSFLIDSIGAFGFDGAKQVFADALADEILGIKDPETYAERAESHKWGSEGARRIDEARRERTRKEGERRARSSRARQSFAWTYDNWTEEQQDLFDLAKRYGSRQKAEEFYRNRQREALYEKAPWMKTLVKASVIEQKHIPIISKKLDKIIRMPIFGHGLGMLIKHPSIAAYAATAAYLSKSVAADQTISRMGVGLQTFYSVPRKFRLAAGAVGMDETQMQQAWYSLVSKYGDGAMTVLEAASASMAGRTQAERIKIAESYGLDTSMARVSDIVSDKKPLTKSERTALAKRLLDKKKAFGYSSEASFGDFWDSLMMTIMSPLYDRLTKDAGEVDRVLDNILKEDERINAILEKVPEAQEAATSAERYEANRGGSGETNITNGDINITANVTFNGNADTESAMKDVISGATQGARAVQNTNNVDSNATGFQQ